MATTTRDSTSQRPRLSQLELRCPPLPQTLMEALDFMEHPERLEVRPVTRMVQRDPFVVARLLHIANSAYYGLRKSISSAEKAVVMLGPVAVVGVVIGMNMLRLRKTYKGIQQEALLVLIRHGLATAFLARHLLDITPSSRRKPVGDHVGAGFTAGLLHDFGKLVLLHNFPDKASALYTGRLIPLPGGNHTTRMGQERTLFGYNHVEAGEYAARKLGFADVLTATIQYHHTPEKLPHSDYQRIVWGVSIANALAHTMGFGTEFGNTHTEQLMQQATRLAHWLVEQREVAYASADKLFQDLYEQQDHMQEYIHTLIQDT